jgi:hypothetical protein
MIRNRANRSRSDSVANGAAACVSRSEPRSVNANRSTPKTKTTTNPPHIQIRTSGEAKTDMAIQAVMTPIVVA